MTCGILPGILLQFVCTVGASLPGIKKKKKKKKKKKNKKKKKKSQLTIVLLAVAE